jgi:hypothetical protein
MFSFTNNQARDSGASELTQFKTPTSHTFTKLANPFADRTQEFNNQA